MTVVVPNVPTPVPSRADPVNFAARADAYHEALPVVVNGMNAQNAENNALHSSVIVLQGQVQATKDLAVSQTTAIKDQALAAEAAAEAAAANAAAANGGQLWVSGTTYAVNFLVYSPLNRRSYRRLVAGAGTTDPSLDPTSWGLLSVVVEQADIGTAPNQVPLNQYLGTMAFEDLGNVNILGGIATVQLRRRAPVAKTASFTLADNEHWINCTGTASIAVSLPDAATNLGREVMIKNLAAFTVVSASANVIPLLGGAATTAILPATAGKFVTLVSNGTAWEIAQAN